MAHGRNAQSYNWRAARDENPEADFDCEDVEDEADGVALTDYTEDEFLNQKDDGDALL